MKRLSAGAALLLLAGLWLLRANPFASPTEQELYFAAQQARFEKQLAHAAPGSYERYRAQQKLDKLAAIEAGTPAAGYPNEFARVLYEMKTPSDLQDPEYGTGYRQRELREARKTAHKGVPLPWVSRGPFNVSGRARGLVVDLSDPTNDTWWVGSVGGGIWRTTDGGATWQDMAPDLANINISWIVQAPSNPDVFYAGTGESFFNIDTINGNGVLKSVDHGATWFQLASTVDEYDFNNISRIIVDPTDEDVVLVSATTGRYKIDLNQESHIFRSTDGGVTWDDVFVETEIGSLNRAKRVTQLVYQPGNFNLQLAGVTEKGILRSTDGGQTWAYSNTGITDFTGRFELAFSTVNTDRVFASAQGAAHSELWLSEDAGQSWVETFQNSGSEPNWLGAQGWYDNTIVCHPTDPDIVYVGGIRIWKLEMVSATQRTKLLLDVGPVHVDNHNLMIIDDGGGAWRILNANDGGVGVSGSADGNWSKPTDGMVTGQFYGADKRPGRDAYFGGMQDNGTWWSINGTTANDPWTFAIGGDGYETSWHFDDPLKMFGGYQYNGFMRSLDGGQSWEGAANGLADTGGGNAPFLTKVGKSSADPDRLYAVGASGGWYSPDFGGSWTNSTMNDFADWTNWSSFADVRVSRADPTVVWIGSRMDATGKIHVSTDSGVSFDSVNNYTTVTMGGISGLATHPTLPGTAFVLFSFAGRPKVLRTDDYGASWADISGFEGGSPSTNGFPDVAVYDLLVMPHDPNTIWVGSEIGLIESTDGGASWALADNGFPNIPIWFMTHVEDEVVFGTHGRGVWSVEIPAMVAGLTFNPLIEEAYQGPSGPLTIAVNLRSGYDQTEILIDGIVQHTLPANSPGAIATVEHTVVSAGTVDVQVRSTKDAQQYLSVLKSVAVTPLYAAAWSYANDFNSPSDDFFGSEFTEDTPAGFANPALHSIHDYPDALTQIHLLKQPIIVLPGNGIVRFDEICIVEPGEPGSVFGDGDFWDYCVVEGSLDGTNWTPLADGYDARADNAWLNAYNAGDPGDSGMFRTRNLNLLDVFAPSDRVLLRFRLFADAFVNAWGWAIDDIEIQPGPTAVDEGELPRIFSLGEATPNPFNPATQIRYALPNDGPVSLKIFDLRGRLVRTMVDGPQAAGNYTATWNGIDDAGASVASGVYVYRMQAGEFVQQRKMTLVK